MLYARNELDDALRHATEAVTLGRQVVESFLLAPALDALAWIRQAMGDAEAALEAMDEAYGMLPATAVARHILSGRGWRARLLLALGRAGEAARWTEERGLTADDAISYQRERDYLVLARVLLAGQARRGLAAAGAPGRPCRRPGPDRQPHRDTSAAVAGDAGGGDHQGALTALAEALSLARPEGYVRVFADEGPPMAALLRSLIRARLRGRAAAVSPAGREHVNRVVTGVPAPGGKPASPAAAASGLMDR